MNGAISDVRFKLSVFFCNDEKTREREFGVYKSIEDNFPKYVLSMDRVDFGRDGVIHKNIVDFLSETV